MTTPIQPGEEVFLDTSYALALSAPSYKYHAHARLLANELESKHAVLVTFREIGNAEPCYRPGLAGV